LAAAIVGCGYVADFYMATREAAPQLRIVVAYDTNASRRAAFSAHYRIPAADSMEAVLADPSIALVLNLTNPRSHYDVTRACLLAGKHVYSEKPLAMTAVAAGELAALARTQGLYLAAAPCSVLAPTAQTLWKALRDGAIGRPLLVYANFEAGLTSSRDPSAWRSASGAAWPARDEFEVGCTYEHAGYLLTWLGAWFGPARRVTAFATCLQPDKTVAVDSMAPDFSVGCIEYGNGVIARVTNGLVAPTDRSLTVVGKSGVLYVKDVRDDACPVFIRHLPAGRIETALEYRMNVVQNRIERLAGALPWTWGRPWRLYRKLPFVQRPNARSSGHYKPVDFLRGPVEMVNAIATGRQSRLAADFAVHITEIVEVLQFPERFGGGKELSSTFAPIEPVE